MKYGSLKNIINDLALGFFVLFLICTAMYRWDYGNILGKFSLLILGSIGIFGLAIKIYQTSHEH